MAIIPEPIQEQTSLVDHYIKIFPDRYRLISYKTPYPVESFAIGEPKKASSWLQPDELRADSMYNSIQRSKTRLSDIVLCNDFDLFVTLTLNCRACRPKCTNKPCTCDRSTCQRYNLDYAIRTVKTWYNNMTKRYGTFPRVQVMELHKDGGIHFHALFKDYPGELKFHKNDKDGRPVYNLKNYRKGYSTAKRIYDLAGTSSYIRKYIMKGMPVFPGKKRFWSSQNLRRPIIIQDDRLAQAILTDRNAEIWQPEPNEHNKQSNIRSITTLMTDNHDDYEAQLEALECTENFLRAMDG